MNVQEQIKKYITSQPEPKRSDMRELHRLTLQVSPECKLWFFDGRPGGPPGTSQDRFAATWMVTHGQNGINRGYQLAECLYIILAVGSTAS